MAPPSALFHSTTMADHADQDQRPGAEQYQAKDSVGASIKATLVTGGAGAFLSTIQNTLTKQNVGAFGIFTRTGGTIALFGMSKSVGPRVRDRLHATRLRD